MPSFPAAKLLPSWNNVQGQMILISGFPNAGKSSIVTALKNCIRLETHCKIQNKKYWLYNESGSESCKFHFIHITNDSFYSGDDIDHTRMTQSVSSIHDRWAKGNVDRTLTVAEGHRVFLNESLVRSSCIHIWIHTLRQIRRTRYKTGFNDSDWFQKCHIEEKYLESVKHIIRGPKCNILSGL